MALLWPSYEQFETEFPELIELIRPAASSQQGCKSESTCFISNVWNVVRSTELIIQMLLPIIMNFQLRTAHKNPHRSRREASNNFCLDLGMGDSIDSGRQLIPVPSRGMASYFARLRFSESCCRSACFSVSTANNSSLASAKPIRINGGRERSAHSEEYEMGPSSEDKQVS